MEAKLKSPGPLVAESGTLKLGHYVLRFFVYVLSYFAVHFYL